LGRPPTCRLCYDLPICVHTNSLRRCSSSSRPEERIVGVKDSSGDDVGFRWLCELNADAGSPLTLLTGHETVVDGAYLAGADGSVPGLANVDPAGYVRLHRAAMAGDWATVRSSSPG
jgi:4-hydroxy-tetrahydrodipicolinate synthase